MHHSLKQVARSRFFDPDEFQEFALKSRNTFSINGSDEHPSVSTWNVDALADAFKEHLGDEYPSHRQRQIDIQREERELGSSPKM